MLSLILKIFILLFFSISNLNSEIIKKIDISGNKRISNETVIIIGKISEGKSYDENSLNEVVKNLYESNFFSDIKIFFEDGIIKINLVENPIIEDIQFTGIKNKTFLEEISNLMVLKTECLLPKIN